MADSCAVETLDIEHGALLLYRNLFTEQSTALFHALAGEAQWQQHRLRIFGRLLDAPRLSAWHGEPGCRYRYSGLTLEPLPLGATMQQIRQRVEQLAGQRFNSVLLNLYRDGNDSMSWHSDDEPELGPAPVIASVSLGAARRFLLRRRGETRSHVSLDLPDGSLLLMQPPLQAYWQHSLPRTRREVAPRINLTWRFIEPHSRS